MHKTVWPGQDDQSYSVIKNLMQKMATVNEQPQS